VCGYRGGACFPSPRSVGELVGDLRPSLKLFMTPTVFSGSIIENLHVNKGVSHPRHGFTYLSVGCGCGSCGVFVLEFACCI